MVNPFLTPSNFAPMILSYSGPVRLSCRWYTHLEHPVMFCFDCTATFISLYASVSIKKEPPLRATLQALELNLLVNIRTI